MGISLNPSTLLSGQGLDINSLVSQLINQKSGQLTEWQNEQTTLQTQAGALKQINDDLNNLATAVTALSDPLGALTAQAASSSNTAILTATATTSAPAGQHSLVVNNLATPGLVYADPVAGGASVSILPSGQNIGDLQLQIGGAGGTTADVQITAGTNDTFTSLASSINALSTQKNWGITASVVTDANGARLSIVSQATGTPGAIQVSTNTTSLKFENAVGGMNASVTIDGVPYQFTANTIPVGAIPGVTVNLASAAPNTAVQLSVGPDVQQATEAINNFVSAYNTVINDINQQFAVNPATDSQGPLAPDSALRALQSSLMQDATYSVSGNSGLVNLAALGINMNDDGTLTVGTTPSGQALTQVLTSNPSAFQNFFQTAASTGFANHFHTDLINLTDPTIGLLNVDLAQNKTEQQNLADNINNFENQLTAQQQQLTQQLSQVNASLQSYPLLLQQVTEALATMDSGSSGGGSTHPTLTSGL
ncbi:MAG TPA: flagellar filament capping protein FliD [Candidatus Sulfotelmatobacter sp.]|nr:flagellar filament capping protein FliD [Candidatus Sulfotelmatobacter sp.]